MAQIDPRVDDHILLFVEKENIAKTHGVESLNAIENQKEISHRAKRRNSRQTLRGGGGDETTVKPYSTTQQSYTYDVSSYVLRSMYDVSMQHYFFATLFRTESEVRSFSNCFSSSWSAPPPVVPLNDRRKTAILDSRRVTYDMK